ncbi:hypothetical protein [Streptomyces sp. NBC_01261]|uniref:hypothetical protein n=1 Tax=Streptomyces sp. NBC_01261 TaxID=2903802 RepID=UPI003FCE72B8
MCGTSHRTGYHVEVTGLLGVDTTHHVLPWSHRRKVDHHGVRLVHEARIVGGELRNEIGGSTDMAARHPLDDVPGLPRVRLIDVALRLGRERPAAGRVERVPE